MTVCVGIKVHDCIIFAADSATSLIGIDDAGRPAIVNVYDHGNKVFNLRRGLPICAMTCGMGNFGSSSVSTLAKDFRRALSAGIEQGGIDPAAYTIQEVAARARAFFFDECYGAISQTITGEHSFEFYIGGYSAGASLGEVWKIVIINGDCPEPILVCGQDIESYVFWGGQPEALNRLLLGYSSLLGDALVSNGLEPAHLPDVLQQVQAMTATPLVESAMPIGDAIRLADFLVYVSKQYVHFLRGADVVGGETDLAAVTKHEGFKWIKRKHYYPRDLNLETDHG